MDQYQIISGIKFITPEIILFLSALIGLVYGVFKKKNFHINGILIFGMLISLFVLSNTIFNNGSLFNYDLKVGSALFNGALQNNSLVNYLRLGILIAAAVCMIFLSFSNSHSNFEIPILLTVSTAALMIMIASNDLMTMYLSMELSSIAMYICISSDLTRKTSSEAGLKYFILSSVMSCIFLFGTTLVASFSESISFDEIGQYGLNAYNSTAIPILFIFGLMMIISAFLFKMSAVPFHAWTPDIYKGAPWYVAIFIGSISKIAIVGLFVRMMMPILSITHIYLQPFLCITAALSMFIGALGAIAQKDLRRMLAYSAIGNIGFVVAAMSTLTSEGFSSGILYTLLYTVIMFIPAFGIVNVLGKSKDFCVEDVTIISKKHPYIAVCFTVIILSMIGLPPFAGFFGKFYLLKSIISSNMQILAILFVVAAVLSSFYYLRMIKYMYFSKDNIVPNETQNICTANIYTTFSVIIAIFCIMNIFFFIAPGELLQVITDSVINN